MVNPLELSSHQAGAMSNHSEQRPLPSHDKYETGVKNQYVSVEATEIWGLLPQQILDLDYMWHRHVKRGPCFHTEEQSGMLILKSVMLEQPSVHL